MNLAKQIRKYLDHHDMSASELAQKAGLSRQTVSDWLSGREPRHISQVKKVAEVFGTTIDSLCFGEGIGEINHRQTDIDGFFGDGWISGVFEVKLRRIRKCQIKE